MITDVTLDTVEELDTDIDTIVILPFCYCPQCIKILNLPNLP